MIARQTAPYLCLIRVWTFAHFQTSRKDHGKLYSTDCIMYPNCIMTNKTRSFLKKSQCKDQMHPGEGNYCRCPPNSFIIWLQVYVGFLLLLSVLFLMVPVPSSVSDSYFFGVWSGYTCPTISRKKQYSVLLKDI